MCSVKCAADNGCHEHSETKPQRAANQAFRCHVFVLHPSPEWATKKRHELNPLREKGSQRLVLPPGDWREEANIKLLNDGPATTNRGQGLIGSMADHVGYRIELLGEVK